MPPSRVTRRDAQALLKAWHALPCFGADSDVRGPEAAGGQQQVGGLRIFTLWQWMLWLQ